MEREKVIKALECRKNAHKRCGNPCEETGACHYATAVRDINGEIYRPFICDRERICTDACDLLKEQEAVKPTGHWIFESAYCEAWTHTCSECGKRMTTAYNTYANYCSNCGAKMER